MFIAACDELLTNFIVLFLTLPQGFYKLLSITFKNCEYLNYFSGISEAVTPEELGSSQMVYF